MHNTAQFDLPCPQSAAWRQPAPMPFATAHPPVGYGSAGVSDVGFVALQQAYRSHGGIGRGDAFDSLPGAGEGGGYIALARLLVGGRLFSFRWHDSIWVPMFQFEADRRTLRTASARVLLELRDVFDGWDLARWYVQPNDWLCSERPLDVLASDLPAVLQAARADRFAIDH